MSPPPGPGTVVQSPSRSRITSAAPENVLRESAGGTVFAAGATSQANRGQPGFSSTRAVGGRVKHETESDDGVACAKSGDRWIWALP